VVGPHNEKYYFKLIMLIKHPLFLAFFLLTFSAKAHNCASIENTILDEDSYNLLRNKFSHYTDVCFEDIPGGDQSMLIKFSRLINGKTVHIRGYCNSLCAALALSADRLILYRTKNAKYPSHMGIHGAFSAATGEWHPSSFDYIDYYYERLKIIDKKFIIKALSYKEYKPNGLIISSAPIIQLAPSKSLVHLCEDFPRKCHSLNVFNLSKMDIIVINE
jgi:hypothetical protein